MNMFIVVGRLVETPEIIDIIGEKENRKELTIELAVPKKNKNLDGIYEKDILKIKIPKELAKNVCEYCEKGDVISANGFIGSDCNLYARTINFISGKKEEK